MPEKLDPQEIRRRIIKKGMDDAHKCCVCSNMGAVFASKIEDGQEYTFCFSCRVCTYGQQIGYDYPDWESYRHDNNWKKLM